MISRPRTSLLRTLSVFPLLAGVGLSGIAQEPATTPEPSADDAPQVESTAEGDSTAANGASDTSPAKDAAGTPGALPSAKDLFKQAREKLAGYRTLKARFIEAAEFGPRKLRAEGTYLQGTDHRVRIDLDVTVGQSKGRLLQVSEGDVLWTVYHVADEPRITRRDISQILAATDGNEGRTTELAELGLGGLPALLTSIDRSMTFEATQSAKVEGRQFFVLQGRWNDHFRQQFEDQMSQISGGNASANQLPPHVPDLVRVYLDSETYFPYRIRYLKQNAVAPGADPTPILTLDFRDIVVNASLDASEFRYTPPADADVADITSAYLQRLRGGNPDQQPAQMSPAPSAAPSPAPGGP